MKFNSIKFFVEEAFKSLFRNGLMSLSSIVTVAACIFIVVLSFCMAVNVDYILVQFEESGGLAVSISDDLNSDGLNELKEKILAIEYVAEVEFVNKAQALEDFAKSLGDDNKEIVSGFDEKTNPLPRSFSITVEAGQYQEQVVEMLSQPDFAEAGVTKVRHALDLVKDLVSINNAIRIVSLIIILILGLLSVTIIMNTIKLTVNSRRHEIGIMKYVGATDWFIRWPFIIEGIIIGICGALIPVVIGWAIYANAVQAITNSFLFIESFIAFRASFEIFPYLAPLSIGLGIVIGALGSITSIRKYLDV